MSTVSQIALSMGKSLTVANSSPVTGGVEERRFSVESDTVLISVYAAAVSGTVDVKVYTQAGDDDTQSTEVISFPTINAPTTELLLKKAAVVMQYIRVVITYTGACTYTVKAKALSTGETSVRLLGQNAATAYATTIGTSATLLIPASISDRVGIALHNTSTVDLVYIGFNSTECTSVNAWEISPGEKLGLDVASGVDVYARAAAGSIKIKIMEAGS